MLKRPPFPRPTPGAVDRLKSRLEAELSPSQVIVEPEAMAAYASDESEQEPVLPDAVVLASSADDVRRTLAIASDVGVPVTPRAAGSGKSGGAVPVSGGIVLACLGMSSIKHIDTREHTAVVEPGVVLADLYAAVEAEGLFYPPDPNSWKMCAIGGNIAENAAGPRAFKYGPTRNYLLGLEVVTASGSQLTIGRRTKKGVTGYDLTALLCGSEGTLAVTTEATLALLRKPEKVVSLLGLFAGVEGAARAVEAITSRGLVPRCLELIDEACLQALRAEGVAIDERARALLMIDVDGDEAACERDMQRVGDAITSLAEEVMVAQDEAQRERLWHARRELSNVTRRLARYKISEDVVVPRCAVPALVDEVHRLSEKHDVRMLTYGHAGDGNLHVNLLWDEPAHGMRVERALEGLFRAVLGHGGTLTGEHGVGTSKAAYLGLEQSEEVIALQREIKRAFDPRGILNPGKIFPRRGHGAC